MLLVTVFTATLCTVNVSTVYIYRSFPCMSRSDSPHRTHSHAPDPNRSGHRERDVRGPGGWPDEHSPQPTGPAPRQKREGPRPPPPLEVSREPTATPLAEALF